MGKKNLFSSACLLIFLLAGCANQDAAQLGSLIGRSLGKPLGVVATALDETLQTTADVVHENPRYHRSQPAAQQAVPVRTGSGEEDFYYRAEVLVRTRGPAQIESLDLQKTEDVSAFWR
jgi:hypothetical protein